MLGGYYISSIWSLRSDYASDYCSMAPWNLTAPLRHGKKNKELFLHRAIRSSLFPEITFWGQDGSTQFENNNGSWKLSFNLFSPFNPFWHVIMTRLSMGGLKYCFFILFFFFSAILPKRAVVTGVVLNLILCICHWCETT